MIVMAVSIYRLGAEQITQLRTLNGLFGSVFEMSDDYLGLPPSDSYLTSLLENKHFIALVAEVNSVIVGGLAAYVLPKFEQERSEIYIYDLAVIEQCRRQGIATALINEVKTIAREIGVWVIYIQADDGDEAPVNLYTKLGTKERVLHFDIDPEDY